jgi:hypothetical protein
MPGMTNEDAEPDLTIRDLLARGDRLGLYCDACSRFRYMKTDNLPGSLNIRGMAEKLSCIRCWSPDVATRPVRRDARTGYWPAESG